MLTHKLLSRRDGEGDTHDLLFPLVAKVFRCGHSVPILIPYKTSWQLIILLPVFLVICRGYIAQSFLPFVERFKLLLLVLTESGALLAI